MPRKSSIKSLPPQIRAEVDRILADGRYTFDDLVAHLRGLGAEVSRSSVHRYSQEYEGVRRKLLESREIAGAFARELGELPQGDMGRVLVEMLHTVVFKLLMAQTEGDGPSATSQDIMFLARGLRDAMATTKGSADLEIRIREDLAKAHAKRLDGALSEAAAAGERGLSAERVAQLRRDFLGVREGARGGG